MVLHEHSEQIIGSNNQVAKIEKMSNGVNTKEKDNLPVNHFEPPDGGLRAWTILVSAFLCNGIIFGIINTYSVVYLKLQEQMKENGDLEASSKAGKQN